eukprot:m.169175 g.169175  ORF g.169175 m.169175 type:complete len:542 (+) comp13068_c0_seq1:105-1730(+)
MLTAQVRRRALYAVAAMPQLALQGTIYAFPLWLVAFKRILDTSQTQANIIGIAVYLPVLVIGLPLSSAILPHISMTTATLGVSVMNLASFGVMYAIAAGQFGHDNGAFTALIATVVVLQSTCGVCYSATYAFMMRDDVYGPAAILTCNGMLNTAFAAGGVIAGCLFYFTALGLEGMFLALIGLQAAFLPLSLAIMYYTTSDAAHLRVAEATAWATPLIVNSDGATLPVEVDDDDVVRDGTTKPLLTSASCSTTATERSALVTATFVEDDEYDDEDQDEDEDDEPEALLPWIVGSLSSWRYYHVILIMLLKVGIGSTFVTNIGSLVAAVLPQGTGETEIDNHVSLMVICLNFAQLLGRLVYTLVSTQCTCNPNVVTMVALMAVSVVYASVYAARILMPLTYSNLVITTCVFGAFYGVMWCTSGALVAFAPYSKNLPRAMAATQGFGGVGTIVLNTLAGALYDRETAHGSHTCYGSHCYRLSDTVMIGVSLLLFAIAALRLTMGTPGPDGRWPRRKVVRVVVTAPPPTAYGAIRRQSDVRRVC